MEVQILKCFTCGSRTTHTFIRWESVQSDKMVTQFWECHVCHDVHITKTSKKEFFGDIV